MMMKVRVIMVVKGVCFLRCVVLRVGICVYFIYLFI